MPSPDERTALVLQEQPDLKRLENILLKLGGDRLIFRKENHLAQLLERGKPIPVKGARLVKGPIGECHENAARYWLRDTASRQLVTGYYLPKDGLWRQHSWVLEGGVLVECSARTVARMYFGSILGAEESASFSVGNIPELTAHYEFLAKHNYFRK